MIKSIYIIKNKINDKVYVGQSKNPHRRFIQHLCNGNCLLDSLPIHLAINKYGKENFYYEILEKDIENYNEKYPLRKDKNGIKISVEDIIKILFLKEEKSNEQD